MFLERFIQLIAVLFCCLSPCIAVAEKNFSVYFSNDSVNGVKISDAYETHNMGLVYDYDDKFLSLDLGIVSPDMHVYKNEYRVANRSFGELVTLSFGIRNILSDNIHHQYFGQVKSTGKFGIDKMQDFMHRLLNLQPVNKVNDIVRMPEETWIGLGGELKYFTEDSSQFFSELGAKYYLGTDRSEFTPYIKKNLLRDKLIMSGEAGFKSVLYDEIVTAFPIEAQHRNFVPYIEVGINFDYFGLQWYIRDRFSLPTIRGDDTLYGVLTAGLAYKFE
jgi:hypothetical protein